MSDDFLCFIEDTNSLTFLSKQIVKFWQTITYVAIIYIVFSSLFFDLYRVTSNSMYPALKGNKNIFYDDRILVFKGLLNLQKPMRGDIIVFMSLYNSKKFLVKRVIGLPREKLYIKPNRNIYINGKPQATLFYNKYKWAKYLDRSDMPENGWGSVPIIVPKNSYFVMGDNTVSSEDSRMWGFVPQDRIIGKLSSIWFPFFRIRSFRNENLSR
ncbi:signal peptidase I [Candidatus Uabimicrobium sp. HlEnr_7]|uniref:signal peptidase I n=1 Tax=Candidatus Uabimicrobium helgolandensis TaxID=3095367 RepID=UPI003558F4B4